MFGALMTSYQVFLGRPLCLDPSVSTVTHHLIQSASSLHSTCPSYLPFSLHWLDVLELVTSKLVSMVHNCLHSKAPQYLKDYCIPVSDIDTRWHLRSASHHQLVVPRHNRSTYGRQAFSVAAPTAWNSLSDELRDLMLSTDSFRRLFKTRLFSEYQHIQRN